MTDWNTSPRNTGMNCSFSPQISDSSAEPAAAKCPTTIQSRLAKRSVSPIAVWAKRGTIFFPRMISLRPEANFRPATRWMLRTANASSFTPRATTLLTPSPTARGMLITTKTSGLTSGRASAPLAIRGSAAMRRALSRGTPLSISLVAPRRSTTTLSGDPVRASVARKPPASASIATKTATTSARPSAVIAVDTGRCAMLRRL